MVQPLTRRKTILEPSLVFQSIEPMGIGKKTQLRRWTDTWRQNAPLLSTTSIPYL